MGENGMPAEDVRRPRNGNKRRILTAIVIANDTELRAFFRGYQRTEIVEFRIKVESDIVL